MFRFKVALIVGGGILAFFGIQEFRVSSGTTAQPTDVDLAQLEGGVEAANSHLKIGEHIAVYPTAVFEYEADSADAGDPGPGAKVNHCYYPVISLEHPFIEALGRLDAEHGGLANVPDEVPDPQIESFAVLVKTKRFKTVGSIPDALGNESSIQGLVVNRIQSLDSEEERLVKESFPTIDLDKVLLLVEGRKPASLAKSLGMSLGGIFLALLGVGLFFVGGGEGTAE